MQTLNLLEVSYHTNSETENNYIGEIDFGILTGNLDIYLDRYGANGKDNITKTLGHLIFAVETRFREIVGENNDIGRKL